MHQPHFARTTLIEGERKRRLLIENAGRQLRRKGSVQRDLHSLTVGGSDAVDATLNLKLFAAAKRWRLRRAQPLAVRDDQLV